MENKTKILKDIHIYFLLGTLLLFLVLLFIFAFEFLTPVFLAIILATALNPLYELLHEKTKMNRTLLTILILFVVLIIIDLIVSWFVVVVAGQATDAYRVFRIYLNEFTSENYSLYMILEKFPPWIQQKIKTLSDYNLISLNDIVAQTGDILGNVSTFLLNQVTVILKQVSIFMLHTIIFILSLFYCIRDGKTIAANIKSLLPLPENHRDELVEKMRALMYGIIFGLFIASILQGILLGFGLALVGVRNAAFWGALSIILATIPVVGTALVWLPVVIVLFLQGHIFSSLFLLLWGMPIVGTADNIAKPYVIGSKSMLHPLAVMIVIFGGIFMFGFKGLIFGPFVLAMTLAFLHIYKKEYQKVLEKKNT